MSTATSTVAPVQPRTSPWARVAALQNRFPLFQIIAIVALFAYAVLTIRGFGNWDSLRITLTLASLTGLAAAGQTFVVLLGGIDMAVSSWILVGALAVTQLPMVFGVPFWAAALAGLIGCLVMGAFSGWVSHRFDVQPLIITLAIGAVTVGLMQLSISGQMTGAAPQWLSQLTSPLQTTFGLPIPPLLALWIVVGLASWWFLRFSVTGRKLYATGASRQAAGLARVRTGAIWVGVFAFSGVFAAFVGILLAGFAGNVTPSVGGPYLFQGIAAVIVGGTLLGGPGSYLRTILGAILLTLLSTVLVGSGFTSADQQIAYGIIIALVIGFYGRDRHVRNRV